MSSIDDFEPEPRETHGFARRSGRRAAERGRKHLDRLHGRVDRPTRVLIRDFAVFEVKLLLDGMKGVAISQAALLALVADLVLRRLGRPTGWFYRVLRLGERADLWLNLYGSARGAEENPEGLFGESAAGSPTLLGQLEKLADRLIIGDEGRPPRDASVRAAPPEGPSPRDAAVRAAPPEGPIAAAAAPRAEPGTGAASPPTADAAEPAARRSSFSSPAARVAPGTPPGGAAPPADPPEPNGPTAPTSDAVPAGDVERTGEADAAAPAEPSG
ncbi:MAG TPA: hypothetical protein VFQ38_09145 [Longimicrobiales bacterium]|nr:hypothetical protein [Longimicrobiales bacterium]